MGDPLRRRYLLLGIPVVVFTTLVGTSAFASISKAHGNSIQGLEIDPDLVLVVVGTISVLAAVLSSLQTFLRYATRAEGHRIAALRYETLRRDMATTLALPREARGEPDKDLNSVRQRMDRYAKESPTIGERPVGEDLGRLRPLDRPTRSLPPARAGGAPRRSRTQGRKQWTLT